MARRERSRGEASYGMQRLVRSLKRWIQWVVAGLAMAFAFLEIQNAPIDKITQAFDANSLTKLGLFLFVTGWGFGATDDTSIQEEVYLDDEQDGALGGNEWLGIFAFIAFFSLLAFVHDRLVVFQACLLGFVVLNIWTYGTVVLGRANAMIRKSAAAYEAAGDNYSYFKLYAAVEYLKGNWQQRRFKTLLVLATIQLVVAIMIRFDIGTNLVPNVTIKGVAAPVLVTYLPSALFVGYVIVSEAWMKIYRYKIFSDFETIEQMRRHYTLARRPRTEQLPLYMGSIFRKELNDNANYH